jgi:uncharacterized protein YndB with AHSA1/START domain
MPDTYTVTREVEVAAPPQAVYERLVDFRRWRTWSPFEELDPGMQRTYGGAERGVGATYAWSGRPKAGTGSMEVVAAVEDAEVVVSQRNEKPFKSTSTSTFTLVPSATGTTVTWHGEGPLTRMMKVMGVVMSMDKVVGPLFEKGLASLKAECEA